MLEDEKNTTFRILIENYYYKVMPFDLKNANATNKLPMTLIFNELIHNQVECYVYDLLIKSKENEEHFYKIYVYLTFSEVHTLHFRAPI